MKNQKNISKKLVLKSRVLSFLACLTIFTVACDSDDDSPRQVFRSATNNQVITVPFFVENENGEMPSSPDDLVHEFRFDNPVIDRSGKHMTWAEFSTVTGTATVNCLEGGFEIDMHLAGLIPDGVYTFWNVTFNEGGMDTSKEMLNIGGIGTIGATDGSENYFTATSGGTGHIKAFTKAPDALSMIGNIAACPLSDEVEFHIVGAYHLDNKTWGPNLGPDGTAVEQFGFIFKNED